MKREHLKKEKIYILLFFLVFFMFLEFSIFDLGFTYFYRLQDHSILKWLMFWTHLSNIGALVWISVEFISISLKKEKLREFNNRWYIKNLVFTFIIVTGVVFMFCSYFPVFIEYTKPGVIEEIGIDPSSLYRALVIIGTTFKHFLIPGIFIFIFFLDPYYSRPKSNLKNEKLYKKTMILSIFPSLYWIYVLFFTSLGIDAPYIIIDFVNQTVVWKNVVNLILNLGLLIIFMFISYFQLAYAEKKLTLQSKSNQREKH